LFTFFASDYPQYELVIDNDMAMQKGISIADAMSNLSIVVGSTWEQGFVRFGQFYKVYVQAVYNYQQTVLNAFTEVVNYMSKVEKYSQSIDIKKQQLEALEASVDSATKLFQNARAEYVEVLLAQRDLQDAKIVIIETKKQQLMAVVNAYQALGGGMVRSYSTANSAITFAPETFALETLTQETTAPDSTSADKSATEKANTDKAGADKADAAKVTRDQTPQVPLLPVSDPRAATSNTTVSPLNTTPFIVAPVTFSPSNRAN